MKVVLISSSYHPYYRGGGEYSVKNLAEKLVNQGHTVSVITAFHHDQQEKIEGVYVYRIKHPNLYWSYTSDNQPAYRRLIWHIVEGYNIRVERPLRRLLSDLKPDVMHIRNIEDFSPYACKVAQNMGIPVVVTLNSYTWLCPRATMFRNGQNCRKQCSDCKLVTYPKKLASRYVTAVVGVSRFMIARHVGNGYFSQAKQQVIYTSTKPHFNSLAFSKNGYKTFGYIGRIHPSKGVAEIIQAFKQANSTQNHRLVIAGTGPSSYFNYCQSQAQEVSNISFLGKVDVQHFYPTVDVIIINSLWHEPFPRVLIESYAYGRPVIATDTGGILEMVSEKTGYIVDHNQPEQLKRALLHFMYMSSEKLHQMQKNIEEFFSRNISDESSEYSKLYQSLIQ
ncbi:MAG: glycosyltransferase family 4 protein [Bacteroidota bacterium]